jgi:hypothetical protein
MEASKALDKLKKLLNCPKNDKDTTVCIEHDKNSKLKKLHISELNSKMLLLQLDNGLKKHHCIGFTPLFHALDDCDHNRVCDAVLLKATEKGLAVTYLELKSDNSTGYVGQFKSTSCFMKYLEELLKNICNINSKIYSQRYVVFHTDSQNAGRGGFQLRKTTQFNPTMPNTPDKAHKYVVKSGGTVRVTEFA